MRLYKVYLCNDNNVTRGRDASYQLYFDIDTKVIYHRDELKKEWKIVYYSPEFTINFLELPPELETINNGRVPTSNKQNRQAGK